MGSVIHNDKGALLRACLDHLGVDYRPGRSGRQQVKCPGGMHVRGDQRPSASVDLIHGSFRCFGCGLSGDGYDILKELEGLDFHQVNELVKLEPSKVEEKQEADKWLF